MVETGVPNLDPILGGGIPEGDVLLVVGRAGSGKTTLSLQMAFHSASRETGVIAVFEEHPKGYLARAKSFGHDLQAMVDDGRLTVIYLRPLDLSVDETLEELRDAVKARGAKRVVIRR